MIISSGVPGVFMYCTLFLTFSQKSDRSKQDTVVLFLQDMLEVVTRDMMVNENR